MTRPVRQPTATQLDQLTREVEYAGEKKILDTESTELLNAKIAQAYAELDQQKKFDFALEEKRDYIVLHSIDHDPEDSMVPRDPRAEREEVELNRLARKPRRKIRRPKE